MTIRAPNALLWFPAGVWVGASAISALNHAWGAAAWQVTGAALLVWLAASVRPRIDALLEAHVGRAQAHRQMATIALAEMEKAIAAGKSLDINLQRWGAH